MGKTKKRKEKEQRQQKFPGFYGYRKGEITTIQADKIDGMATATGYFKDGDTENYFSIQYSPDYILKNNLSLEKYFDEEWRYTGYRSDELTFLAGRNKCGGQGNNGVRTISQTHEYSSIICGDMHRKSEENLRRIIKRAQEADNEFLEALKT